jgi:hypothetical protein
MQKLPEPSGEHYLTGLSGWIHRISCGYNHTHPEFQSPMKKIFFGQQHHKKSK